MTTSSTTDTNNMLGLAGVHAVVTGAAGGIGAATVAQLLACGALVTAHDRTLSALQAGLEPHLADPCLHLAPADMSTEAGAAEIFATARQHKLAKGPATVLVANAGICNEGEPVDLVDMPLEQWRRTYANNVDGTFLTIREFLRHLRDHSSTTPTPPLSNIAIIITGSETAVFGQAGYADYASGKAALQYGLLRTLKNELARAYPRARANAVAPGWVQTPMIGPRLDDPAELYREAQATVALRKVARPEDVARTIVWLASERWSGHVSGQCLSVDGGMEGRLLYTPDECPHEKF